MPDDDSSIVDVWNTGNGNDRSCPVDLMSNDGAAGNYDSVLLKYPFFTGEPTQRMVDMQEKASTGLPFFQMNFSDDGGGYPPRTPVWIYQNDLDKLAPREFLNDTMLDFATAFLTVGHCKETTKLVCAVDAIVTKQLLRGIEHIEKIIRYERSPKLIDIMNAKVVSFPICEHSHWTAIFVLNPGSARDRQSDDWSGMIYFDSLPTFHKQAIKDKHMKKIRQFLTALWDANDSPFDDPSLFPEAFPTCPWQPKGSNDCGVFVIMATAKFFEMRNDRFLSNEAWFEKDLGEKFGRFDSGPWNSATYRKDVLKYITSLQRLLANHHSTAEQHSRTTTSQHGRETTLK